LGLREFAYQQFFHGRCAKIPVGSRLPDPLRAALTQGFAMSPLNHFYCGEWRRRLAKFWRSPF
jgi:hypothetical protein